MENNSFFDPYSYIAGNISNKQNLKVPKEENIEIDDVMTPKEFYDTQYSYYRYLNELIKYKKTKEEQTHKKE